jgi:hypothetical protein
LVSLKNTTIAALVLASNFAFAGSMGPVVQGCVVGVPCASTGWDFGIAGLYLQPLYSANWGYGSFSYPVVAPNQAFNTTYNHSDGPWNWGFMLEGSYHFGTGNDINLNWYHIDGKADFLPGNSVLFDQNQSLFVNSSSFIHRHSRWDAVNGELGQFVNFSGHKKIRFHGGVQYARIQTTIDHAITVVNSGTENGVYPFSRNAEFSGFGPRAGLDMSYVTANGFSIYANAAVAVLAGASRFNVHGSSATAGVGANQIFSRINSTDSGNKRAIVPELDAKVGARYTYFLPEGELKLDAGWMWFNYFNAQHAIQTSIAANTVPMNVYGVETDFGGHGPFVGLKYLGIV